MKKGFFILMVLVCGFASLSHGAEHVLTTIEVASYSAMLETMVSRDIDIRYVPEKSMKGAWLDIQSGTRVLLRLNGSLPDSIMTFLSIYKKWEKKARAQGAEVNKSIGIYESSCMYKPLVGNMGAGKVTLNFKFISVKERTGYMSVVMMVFIKLKSTTGISDPTDPSALIIQTEKAEELYTAMRDLDKLIMQAKAKEKAASGFTR
jgi:hypothetical protein